MNRIMGFFNFFKKKDIEPKIVYFKNLDKWLDSYMESKNITKKLSEFEKGVKVKVEEVKSVLVKLEEASLLNDNIPERVRHIMDGNRKNYIQKITQFLEDIKFPESHSEIKPLSERLSEKIDKLSEETQKSFFVLKEFLETEAAAVAMKVKDIENMTIKLRQDIEDENLDKTDEVLELKVQFDNSEHALEDFKKVQEEKKLELTELKNKESKIKEKIDKLRNSSSFKEYYDAKDKIDKTQNKMKKASQEIIEHFSTLEKALKKYKRGSLSESLIDKYLENSVKALMDDTELKVLEMLFKLKKAVPKLELKDKKEEKTLQAINDMTKDYLIKKQSALNEIEAEKKDLKRKLLSNTSLMSVSEQESWLENNQENISIKNKELEEIEHKIERTNPKLIKQQIRDLLKDFNVELKF